MEKFIVTFEFEENFIPSDGSTNGDVKIVADPNDEGERWGEFIVELKSKYKCNPKEIDWDSVTFNELEELNPIVDLVENPTRLKSLVQNKEVA